MKPAESINITASLLLISMLGTTAALAHGSSHAQSLAPPSSSRAIETATDETFFPTHLLAAVCSLHEHHGAHGQHAAFARRLELVKRAQQQDPMFDGDPPLYDNLGDLSYPITTDNSLAQRYFDQGLRLAYAFNHVEAWRAFRKAREIDPGCAMCYWGEAYALGPNINAPIEPAAMAQAVAAIEHARARMKHTTAKERALIQALAKRYSTAPGTDQATLNDAYAKAMEAVAARFPNDVDIASMYADALMNLSPWNYWEEDGLTLKAPVAKLVETLERALAKSPKHPYAIHLYIHAMEASKTPERAEKYADRLGAQIPGAGHLLHMPFHIYFRTGRFRDAITVNHDAVAADEAYLAQAGAKAGEMYAYGYYPHNVHSLLESARIAGDGATVLAAAHKLPKVMSDEVAAAVPWVQLIKAAPYFAHAQFSAPQTILRLPDPGNRFPLIKAVWHYARGVAWAAQGNTDAAVSERESIAAIGTDADFRTLLAGGVPAPDLVRLMRYVVSGRIAQAREDYKEAVTEFRQAAAIQDALPYMEPPFWYYPVSQSLGTALLQAGQLNKAERVFQESLEAVPNNGWALYGLMQAQKAQGDIAWTQTRKRLGATWLGSRANLDLARL
jgi:tetratricopeptide (TPR) repeat protein